MDMWIRDDPSAAASQILTNCTRPCRSGNLSRFNAEDFGDLRDKTAVAFGNLIGHWRAGNVKWPCAAAFAVAGIIGAAIGSTIGKLMDGQQLLFLFALAMLAVGFAMLRLRAATGDPACASRRRSRFRWLPSASWSAPSRAFSASAAAF